MHSKEFRYRNKDNLNLYARIWTPEGDVRGVIALVHGLGEYGGRYVDIGQSFVDRGYAFVAGDLRGHGVSEGRRAFVSRLEYLIDDLDR
jgi:acylglycerol lipase